jgi:hypothetical protein
MKQSEGIRIDKYFAWLGSAGIKIYLPAILAFLSSALSIEFIRKEGAKFFGCNDPSYFQAIVQLPVSVLIMLLLFWSGRRFKRFLAFEKTKGALLDGMMQDIQESCECGDLLRINIMLIRPAYFCRIEPNDKKEDSLKLNFFNRIFVTYKNTSNMDGQQDRMLNLTVNQGVCGDCFSLKGAQFVMMENDSAEQYKLNRLQAGRARHIKFIACCPFFAINQETNSYSDRILGVVNIDSHSEKLQRIYQSKTEQERLVALATKLAKNCSTLF